MAGTNRYVTQGCCAGLVPALIVKGEVSTDADLIGLSLKSVSDPNPWRFNISSKAASVWRRNGLVLSLSSPTSLHYFAWAPSERGWPPAGRSGARSGPAAQSSRAASRPPASGPSCDESSRPLTASTTVGAPPAGQAGGSVTVGPYSNVGSSLQQQALLRLLGSSTSASHVSGLSLLAGAALGISAVFSGQDSHSAAQWSSCSEEASGPVSAFPSAALERPLPLAHLQAACLASVAAALVQLPRVWGEQAPTFPSLFLRFWDPNAHLGSLAPGTHLGARSPQSWQRDCGPTGPASEAAARVILLPPASCTVSGAWRAGRQSAAGAPPPAALAFAVGAAGAGTSSAAALDEASMGLAYTADRTDSGSCSAARDAVHGTSVDKGSSSSSNSGGGDAAAGRWGGSSGEGSGRLALPPPGQTVQPAMDMSGAAAEAEAEAERTKETERPKVFGNPIRYCKLLFAGAMSAVVSRTCVAPLERVKMDLLLKNGTGDAFTTAAQVLRTEGIAGFWKGNALNVLRTAPFKAVNFFSFDMYRTAFLALSGREENLERFLAGACAGVTATLVCFPLDVVRTRLMASVAGPRYGTGPFSTLAGILRNEGAAALYSGCLPAVIGMAPAGAVFYGVYDMLKHRHLEKLATERAPAEAGAAAESSGAAEPPTLDPLYTLLYGAMAGAASELIVYPLEVIRRKMQLQSMALASMRQIGGMPHHHHHHPHMGHYGPSGSAAAGAAAGGRLAAAAHHHHHHMLPYHLGAYKMISTLSAAAVANSPGLARVAAAVTAILSTDGPRGFYSGLLPNMLQVLPSAALSYYTYDTLKTVLGAR